MRVTVCSAYSSRFPSELKYWVFLSPFLHVVVWICASVSCSDSFTSVVLKVRSTGATTPSECLVKRGEGIWAIWRVKVVGGSGGGGGRCPEMYENQCFFHHLGVFFLISCYMTLCAYIGVFLFYYMASFICLYIRVINILIANGLFPPQYSTTLFDWKFQSLLY